MTNNGREIEYAMCGQ